MADKKKILVTGEAGFIGSFIADELIKLGHEIYGIDDMSCGFKRNINENCIHRTIDLRNADKVELFMAQVRPEIIYSCASIPREGASAFQPKLITETNYMAFMNLIESAIKYKMSKFIHFSSMSVYGNQAPPFSEDMPRQPCDVYGVNKAACEQSIEILAQVHDFRWTILRPHNVFGRRQQMNLKLRNVVAIFINQIMRGEPVTVFGDGLQVRSFSPIENSLPCYIRCLDEDTDGKIYNIGGTIPMTINEVLELVIKHSGRERPKIEYLPDRPLEVKRAFSTYQKSIDELGYEERVSVEDCIKDMWSWAESLGAQNWMEEDLALVNEKTPKSWLR